MNFVFCLLGDDYHEQIFERIFASFETFWVVYTEVVLFETKKIPILTRIFSNEVKIRSTTLFEYAWL